MSDKEKFIDVVFLGNDITGTYGVCQDSNGNIYLVEKVENLSPGSECSLFEGNSFPFGYGLIPF